MIIHVGEAGPPGREGIVAEFHVSHEEGVIEIPAELFKQNGRLMIATFPRSGGEPWEFPLADFIEAIGRGIRMLGG